MAVITQTSGVADSGAPVTVARTTLTASDTLTFVRGSRQGLFLYNTTAALVTVTLTGTAPIALSPSGYGGTITTTGGKAVAVPASSSVYVELDDIWAFIEGNGTVTVTGGTGVVAHLFV